MKISTANDNVMSFKSFDRSIAGKLFPVLIIGALFCSVGVWIGVPIITERGILSDTLHHARQMARQFKLIRGYYTKTVIAKAVKSKALKPSYTHEGAENEIPLPATFIHDLSELFAETGSRLKLYSPYPFPNRAQREMDGFGETAWKALSETPDKPHARTEAVDGRTIVRVAVGDTMVSEVCVSCHNSRADSPKRDWKLNDLRGVLEIQADVTAAIERGTWMGRIIALFVLSIFGGLLWLTFFRLRAVVIDPVRSMTQVMATLTAGDLEIEVPDQDRNDEIGDMARAAQFSKHNATKFKQAQEEMTRMNSELLTLNHTLEDRVKERTKELESVNKELESFADSVSHDLRAPLRTIDGFSHILLTEQDENLDERGKRHLYRIRAGVQRMGGHINDLLRLSRATRGDLRFQELNLSEMVAATIKNRLRETDRSRRVMVEIEPDVPAHGDPRLISVVLEILLGNAWKYTGKEENPTLIFGSGAHRRDNRVYFVKDNGVGFDMRHAKMLFEPFQRLHGVQEFEGNGVGLATAHRIIARHGGRIWAEAKLGEGATFYFTLGREPKTND